MAFAYARLMMLDREQGKCEARLETLERLRMEEGSHV